ncbi:DUF5305 domain-containing protein [Candidatus Halobonum tyrrellensis]|uniref:DUF5305 domain-containing protein n=1 Tax=Candidatus Halobonum tyrrellensis G22 TaxID=1324957 RepID=V4HIG1_9EURY|nr:DUF5305 domain-containing protein [Candidatus Halobonum tyrrellensis]ESP89558.1 hypothetical protein K933_03340 [Candidatus Halobonum tyrrellensis G22]
MSDWNLRARALVDEYFGVVAALLVVLVLVGGAASYTAYAAPSRTTEERVVSSWRATGAFSHGANVTEENPVFPAGERVENRSVYFTRVSPVLSGEYVVSYTGADRGNLTASVHLALVHRAVSSDGTVYWETRESLADRRVGSLDPGERVAVPYAVDVPRATNRTAAISTRLGGSPGEPRTLVVATVRLDGRVDGRRVDRTLDGTLTVSSGGDTYRADASEPAVARVERTETVAVPAAVGPVRRVGGPLLVLFAAGGLVGLAAARSRGTVPLTDDERAYLSYRADRADFDEWVSTASLPAEAFDRPRVEVDSLADLVDVAIDTDGRVLATPDGSGYYLVVDGFLYAYDPPERPDEAGVAEATTADRDGDDHGDEDDSPTDGV